MIKPWEAFIFRASPDGIQHHTVEVDPEDTCALDAWGNEWETDSNDEWINQL